MSAVSGRQHARNLPPPVAHWGWQRDRRRLFVRICGILIAYIVASLLTTLPDGHIPTHTPGHHVYVVGVVVFESLLTVALVATLYRTIDAHLSAPARQIQGMLQLLADLVDTREHAVYGHSSRVSDRSRTLARAIGLPPEESERIACAALLHDVGKIGIPDHILLKSSALDAQERTTMMEHAAIGGGIVVRAGALASLAPVVRHHHEWYDGHGYPDGLSGRQIPVGSRILAVADALDTMTGGRPYRPGRTLNDALAEVRRQSGIQFDPVVVEAATRLWGAPLPAEPAEAPLEPRTLAEQARLKPAMAASPQAPRRGA